MDPIYFSIPVISGLIGWGTNCLAVRMIFRPRRPLNILGFKLQGLIPKRRSELALKISETVSEHLISHNDFLDFLKKTELDESFKIVIDEKLEHFINQKLFSFSPMLAGFLSEPVKNKIKELIVNEMADLLPELAEKMVSKVESSFDTKKIVFDKINSFDTSKLETIILNIASKELKTIEIYGGVLGIFIGFIQLFIISTST